MAYYFVRGRRADRADRAERADLARPRRVDGRRRLHDRKLLLDTAYGAAARRCSLLAAAVAGAGRRCSSASPPRGCAGPISPARPSRSRSACPRSPTRYADASAATNGLTVVAADAAAGARRDFPLERWQAWIACAGRAHHLCAAGQPRRAAVSGARCARCATTRSPRRCPGCDVARLQVLAFVVSAACAGLAGGLFVVVTSLAAPGAFPLALSLSLLAGVVLGGLGSLAGAVWGAVAAGRCCRRGPTTSAGRCRCRTRCRPTCRSPSTAWC